MSRFRWSSLYSPTNKSKLAFKFWHPRVHDYCTILCSRPSCVSRNTNKLLQQFLCTSAKNFMLIIGSAPVNFFYFIFLLKTKESASLAWLFLHTGRWPACIESVFYWICGSRIFSLETLIEVLRMGIFSGYFRLAAAMFEGSNVQWRLRKALFASRCSYAGSYTQNCLLIISVQTHALKFANLV